MATRRRPGSSKKHPLKASKPTVNHAFPKLQTKAEKELLKREAELF
jgi:hypothetical protein